jgi:2-polyprenyl-6-methoxyphenol hydroxylase-like FAD-dependent oxidoreductase
VSQVTQRYGRGLVIGGGIAGPVVAMALQRVGIESTVFEASPVPSDGVGAFLTLASNGLDALQAIDAHRPVVAAGVRTERMVLSSGTGKFLGVVEAGIPLTDGTTTTTIERAQLYRVLHDQALQRGIPVVHGKRLVDLEQSPDGVVARFADGAEERGGFLVGADGIWSTTRELLDPEAPRPEYTGLLGVGGVARGVDLEAHPSSFEMMFGARAFFGFLAAGNRRVLWFANLPTRPEPDRAALEAVSSRMWRERLLEAFAEDAVPVRDLIKATPEAALRAAAMHTLEPPRSWHSGRAVLVGDAAHATSPSSGQGASLAAEDAVELARCLRDVPDLGGAFHAYQRLREGRVRRVLRAARRVNSDKAAGPFARRIRDAVMPLMLRTMATPERQLWLLGHHIDFTGPVGGPRALLAAA